METRALRTPKRSGSNRPASPLITTNRLAIFVGILFAAYVLLSVLSVLWVHHGDERFLDVAKPRTAMLSYGLANYGGGGARYGLNDIIVRSNNDLENSKQRSLDLLVTKAEKVLKERGSSAVRKTLTAYIEPPVQDTVPGTGTRGDLANDKDAGIPPEFVLPYPLRTQKPSDLRKFEYPKVQTCHDMPAKFPIDRGVQIGPDGRTIEWNAGDQETPDDIAGDQEASYCPVEADPFLPWIHDVIPSQDGSKIQFIAQNKRLCRTGSKNTKDVNRLIPQVALLQSVSVQRLNDTLARDLAPELWHPSPVENSNDAETNDSPPRYRLAPFNESSPDGMYTRFICRFHTVTFDSSSGEASTVVLGETLSQYPFNYEMAAHRKSAKLLSPKGKDSTFFWTSTIQFNCPIPTELQHHVSTGATILSDGTPTVYLDLIPIRTSVRYEEIHITEDLIGPKEKWKKDAFDAQAAWGDKNVLPRVEASGRWANIPICSPPELENGEGESATKQLVPGKRSNDTSKPHYLSACLWASAEYKTRGVNTPASTDTQDRLIEWLEFHLMVGFDHFYVYDNSGAHSNSSSLEPILSRYPGRVTRIDWPSVVCNNNIPAHDSSGERSSQYAAENSCRTRYAPFTEWIVSFDTDEYLVPMGNYTNLKDVLADAAKNGTNIMSFRSTRSRLRPEASVEVNNGNALEKSQNTNTTFLEAYNCDSAGSPKPEWADRARKQVYRTDYVLYHYVHYSTVTKGSMQPFNATRGWRRPFLEGPPSEQTSDEMHQAVMIHTKSVKRDMTVNYKNRCRFDYPKKWHGCWVAFPWPKNAVNGTEDQRTYNADGMDYNCYVNEKAENIWIPKLKQALKRRRDSWGALQELQAT